MMPRMSYRLEVLLSALTELAIYLEGTFLPVFVLFPIGEYLPTVRFITFELKRIQVLLHKPV